MKKNSFHRGIGLVIIAMILSIACWGCRKDVYDYREEIPIKFGESSTTLSLPKGMYSVTVTYYESSGNKTLEKFLDAPSLKGLVTATITKMNGQVVHSGFLEKEVVFSVSDKITPVAIGCKLNKEDEPGRAYYLVVRSTF